LVTFTSHIGKQPLLEASPANNWAGTNPIIEVSRVREGLQPLSGTVRLGFEGERSLHIPFDADAPLVKQALESLSSIGEVDVARYRNNNGHNWFITFISELGNRQLITVDDSQLMGPDARAKVATIIDGTEPEGYGSVLIQHPSQLNPTSIQYQINGLDNGIPYYVRIRSRNDRGFGYASLASPSPMTPVKRPSSPTSVSMFPLSDTAIRVSWQASLDNGGLPITKYAVQMDVDDSFPNAWNQGYFHEKLIEQQVDEGDNNAVYCLTLTIDPSSSDMLRYGRVLAYNGYEWSDLSEATVLSTLAVNDKPGPVRDFNALPTSNIGMVLSWSHPSINDEESCDYAGDGGEPITHYVVEYDEENDFNSPAVAITVPSSDITELRIGGRDVLTGAESSALKASGVYYARITPFNSVGPGTTVTFPSAIGPLEDTLPSPPVVRSAIPASATSIQVEWDTPTFDGGSVIQEFIVEYDIDPSFQSMPKNITLPTISEVKALQVASNELELNVQTIQATVAVTNEVQSIKTSVDGVDEIQEITTTCDDVTAEVQMIMTTAVDTNEEQIVSLISDDVDEIQLVRLQGDNQVEIQSVQISVPRVNEVQKFGIVVSNINTDGDGIQSMACAGINVGDPCPDIENALSGSFTVSFDFDDCGNGDVNYCQLALSEYEPSWTGVSCSPGLVIDPYVGGGHCVSEPVTHSYSSSEGDAGTLQQVLNDLVDDNDISFMTSSNIVGKQQALTVTRTGRIKTKGSCTLDSVGNDPASCTGEYELLYEIEFDAVHSSGDVPPITIVTSDFRLDTSSASYSTAMCPVAYFVDGCESPVGAALDASHGSFYNGEAGSVAIESTKGSQPTGMVTLDYECESTVTVLPDDGSTMTVSSDGMSTTFDDAEYVANMIVGQQIRFSAGDGIDYYRKITSVDDTTDSVVFDVSAPVNDAIYTDVEFGDYFSDWNMSDGMSGVSSHCQGDRIHTTLPIDVTTSNLAMSETDWRGKIGALSVIDSSGITVSRNVVPDMTSDIGLIWDVTFNKQPGVVHEMTCSTVSGINTCSVNTLQESSIIDGVFKLQTTWPHEYVSETPQLYETGNIRWNSDAQSLKDELEAITDVNGDKVFGMVDVVRTPYIPPSHSRWLGGYMWTITFLSRGGNIPSLTFDNSSLTGITNPFLEVSDEDSGTDDLYQGVRNSATFSADDPGLARDGNQVSGSFALSWLGNGYHDAIATTSNVFTVQTGGSSSDQYTALSADGFKALFEEHVLSNSVNQVDVVRSEQPTQWMGFTYTIIFRHEDVGGDVPSLTYMLSSPLVGSNSYVQVDETIKGTELVGTFQLRYEGETTRPINHDATPQDVQEALNDLNTIAPSVVEVSGGGSPIRSGPSNGIGGISTQVGGHIWYVTFASNVWQDPTVVHDSSFVPGNWIGSPVSASDTWNSGFSKAWGKNVGNVPMISCLHSGLSTTNGALPDGGCSVSELVPGTDPLGGSFKICLDTASNSNNVISVEVDACTDFIAHNALASANESGGDGSSVEEKLEELANVGDVRVTRSEVNPRNGGYTWKVQFLYDVDGPCEQKDDVLSLCNSAGDVQKLCDNNGATPCDTSSLKGTCLRPGSCDKLTVFDATDVLVGEKLPGGNEKQVIYVKDVDYLGWEDGSIVDTSAIFKEYRLYIDGEATSCIKHNALTGEVATSIQTVLDNNGVGGSVRVDRTRSEHLAENGFVYYLTFYDTAGDLPLITASTNECDNYFEPSQSVVVAALTDGELHPSTCEDCQDGIVQRGDFTTFEVSGEGLIGTLAWNADPAIVKAHLEQSGNRVVDVTRSVLDKYGTIEWLVTFTKNVGTTPPGAGDVDAISVVQDVDTAGRSANIVVNEVIKGSGGLSGTFDLDYQSSGGPRTFSFDEPSNRMDRKLEEMSTIGSVFVTREEVGVWDGTAGTSGTVGGYQWTIVYQKNQGSAEGLTWPPGTGIISPPSIDHTYLLGEDATVSTNIQSSGSAPLTGIFKLVINGESTSSIPYNVDANAMKYLINDLQSVGGVSVKSGIQTNHLISGITANVVTDGTVASLTGGGEDLREHLAPGDMFRIGGSSSEIDGAEKVGSVSLTPLSPVLSGVHLDTRAYINVDETVRIGADTYSVVKNGVEVQQIEVHRDSSIADGDFYQLKVTIQGVEETTSCLTFDASALEVESTLNSLTILDIDVVTVTKSDTTTGFTGDSHSYKVYFGNLGNVDEMIVETCITGVDTSINSSNSGVSISTLKHGGKTEHQQITLASDAGSTSDTPAFRLTISDDDANSWNSPCFAWGTPSLDISSIIDADMFGGGDVTVLDSLTDNGSSVSELTIVTLYSDAEIIESNDGLYKINVEFEGMTKSTTCLSYGASALEIQQEIGSLFDYNQDGVIDSGDEDHVSVSRNGDGSSSNGFGYSYEFVSNGSTTTIGASGVLGSSAPSFNIVDIGASGGCIDPPIDGGSPHFDVKVARRGVDEYVYDIFFTGSHWTNVPEIVVNTFGDGVCAATSSDIINGMNRGIGVKTIVDGGGTVDSDESDYYVLDRVVQGGLSGQYDVYIVPPVFTIHSDSSEVQQMVILDDDNTLIWGSGSPSYKLLYDGEYTSCIAHNALESEVENELNTLSSLCLGNDCVTVTRSQDSVLAPNGHVYTLYFDSSVVARQNINELVVDANHLDCIAFDLAGGEKVVISTILQGDSSAQYSSSQLPFGGNHRWLGESASNLPIYRTSGMYWFVTFEQSLGSVDMSIDPLDLSANAYSSVEPNARNGVNPNRVVIPNLSTGIQHYAQVYSRTSFGISSSSSTIAAATPSDKPEKLTNLVSKHALHKNEVQSIVIAATHQDEVQTVITSAIAIPEVQEITLKGAADSDMSTYFFSVRQPEVQVVKWTSSSTVTAGSFFLKLSHVDRANSNLSGSIVYKEMQTPCISFDATADELKTSVETDALMNGLGVDSLKVTRSGNGNYGYSYEIQFVGGNVRGNMQELTSDITLSGLDSSGGNTCTAFESPTNDATLEIWTDNESDALGTDTPRAEVVVDANIDIIDGEFQLSVTHFGKQQTTSCISWNSTAEEVQSALESLVNVDSVRVDKTGDGSLGSDDDDNLHISYVIYFDGNAMHTDGYESSGFMPLQGSNFIVTNPSSCQPLQAYHNNVRYDVTDITDAFASVSVVSKYDGEHTLPGEPTSSSSVQISNALTSSLPMSIAEAQVTQSIETDDNSLVFTITYGDEDGDVPLLVCNQSPSLTSLVGCETNTVMDGNELRGDFYLNSSDRIPWNASPSEMASALGSVSGIGQVKVSRSHPDGQEGYTWTITFIEDHGDVPLLQASSSLTGKGATILVTEVTKGNELGGVFSISFDSSEESTVAFDVDEVTLGLAIESLDGIGQIDVSATGQVDSELGRSFTVTFLEPTLGDVPLLVADSSQLSGLGAVVSVSEVVKGSLAAKDALSISFDLLRSVDPITEVAVELSTNADFSGVKSIYQYFPDYSYQVIRVTAESGFFTVAYNGSQGSTIGAAASSDEMREALEGLDGIKTVAVERVQVTGGYEWIISFYSYTGDIMPLSVPTHHLLPEEATVEIFTKDCDECMYVGGLSMDTAYYIRARVKNSRGWSEYTDNISGTPRAIPSAPTNVHVNAISGECLEVSFHPPVYGSPLTSYVVQWDYDDQFVNAQDDDTASCTSLRYGNCVISQIGGSPPLKYEICNLNESDYYYVRVAARNEVAVQVISTSGYPKDNTNWSGIHQMAPMNQVPDSPMSLQAVVLGKNGVQLSFDWPIRDGGKAITEFVVAYSTLEDFSCEMMIASSSPDLIPNSGDRFVFDFIPTDPPLETGTMYFIKLTAVNDVGVGASSAVISVVPSGPSLPPNSAVLSTLEHSNLPIQEATVSWIAPVSSSSGGYPIDGYYIEWFSQDKLPEVQVVRLLYTTHLAQTTFSLSFSPSPTVKKETASLPWNTPADLVRREILNLGWDESDDMMLISDVKVSRTTLSNGFQWTITFGDNPDRLFNDGDQVSLTANVMDNGDGLGSSTMTVSTLQDGRRSGGMNEVQYLQVSGTGTLSGHYRLKFEGSEWTTLIPIHANAEYVKNALEQLSSIGEVDVVLNDSVAGLIHQLEITFLSNVGNLDPLVVDIFHISDNAMVVIVDGSNEIDSLLNTKSSSTIPGELPVHYGNSGLLDPSTDTYQITGLQTGTEYFVAVSASNSVHGLSKRMLPSPVSITPPLQSPEVPQQVSLSVNSGISDSLIIDFDAPESNGGSDILFYRVELDPTPSFDNPIVQDFHCPASNKRTEWAIETSADGGGVINGGSFVLELEVGSFTALTDSIPYDAVALSSNETGISSELIPTFSLTSGSDAITTIPAVNIEGILFPGDRLRFSGQSTTYKYYEVSSVTGTGAVLTEAFSGDDGVQVSTTRHYGGRGSPLSSRIHCQYDESLCPVTAEAKSGSLQGKLEDLSLAIQNGVFVDRDGPNNDNGFIWRVTFQDDIPTSGDYTLRVHSNSLTTYENNGSAHVSVSLLNSGRTYGTCTGPLVMPSLGGLVKGLQYHGRVSARNSGGYSLPVKASQSVAPMVIPSAPTSVTLDVISATELRVLFGSPSDNGGDSITQYLIEWSTSSDFDVVQSSTLEYLQGGSPFFKNIEGLDTGTYYYVRVRAKNSQGYGISQMSTPASMNPHQKPSPPTNVRQGITSNTMLTVGWEAPLSDGGDSISKYRIEWDTKASFASSSYPPHKGYVDVGPTITSHTIQLLSSQKTYYVRVFAMNTSGSSSGQLATPNKVTPSMQVPGRPHSLQAEPGSYEGSIEVSWQRPRIPNHSISCFNDGPIIKDCPTPYGGGLPASDGGEDIVEYELEWSHLADFSGSDGGR